MKILVVVDMQRTFEASNLPQTIDEVIAQIELFREKDWPIIVLEYEDNSLTHGRVLEAAAGYDRFILLRKRNDDGSPEIMRAIRAYPEWYEKANEGFRFVGVNTDACVKWTVRGLAEKIEDREIEVWLAGCNSRWGEGQSPWPSDDQNVVFREVA